MSAHCELHSALCMRGDDEQTRVTINGIYHLQTSESLENKAGLLGFCKWIYCLVTGMYEDFARLLNGDVCKPRWSGREIGFLPLSKPIYERLVCMGTVVEAVVPAEAVVAVVVLDWSEWRNFEVRIASSARSLNWPSSSQGRLSCISGLTPYGAHLMCTYRAFFEAAQAVMNMYGRETAPAQRAIA
eukprot:825867-Pelagomonas_calceolata.AAC.13